MSRVIGVIQARMGSKRLPGKVLMPLAGAPLLLRLVERLSCSKRMDGLVVATSTEPLDDAIVDALTGTPVDIFRGSEQDVLARMKSAAEAAGAEVVVRLTADNPMVDGLFVDLVLDRFLSAATSLSYAQTVDGSGFPYGLSVEVVTMAALAEADRSTDPSDREHVTRFVRLRPRIFPALVVKAPVDLAHASVTVDSPEDYVRVKELFEVLYSQDRQFTYEDVLRSLAGASKPAPVQDLRNA